MNKKKQQELDNYDNYAVFFVEWLTREDSDVAVLYGKEDRFCSKKRSYSTVQMLKRFKREINKSFVKTTDF